MDTKRCPLCDEVKVLGEFGRNRANKSGRQSACLKCHTQRRRGYAQTYILQQRPPEDYPEDATLRCAQCGETKLRVEFNRNRSNKSGMQTVCRVCSTLRSKDYRTANPDSARVAWLKQTYGLTATEFDQMREAQGGSCAICFQAFAKTPHVDHDHTTGTVRGLLCGPCNRGLGIYQDSPDRLRAAISYLELHQNEQE